MNPPIPVAASSAGGTRRSCPRSPVPSRRAQQPAAAVSQHDLLHHQRRRAQRRRLRRHRGRRQALPGAGRQGRRRRQDLARLSQRPGRGRRQAVNARDRIGKGPWVNAAGVQIAASVDDLHSRQQQDQRGNRVAENGRRIPSRLFVVNQHDILTGTQTDGTAPPPQGHDLRQLDQVAAKARPWSATTTAWACATMRRRSPGTPRIPRAAAAVPGGVRRRRAALLLRGELTRPAPQAASLTAGSARQFSSLSGSCLSAGERLHRDLVDTALLVEHVVRRHQATAGIVIEPEHVDQARAA